MKKILYKVLMAGLVLGLFAGNASATDCTASMTACDHLDDDTNSGSGIDLKLSPNVQLAFNANNTAYLVATWNSSGTKAYGANSIAQGMYVSKTDLTTASDVDGKVPDTASASFGTTDWAVVGQ